MGLLDSEAGKRRLLTIEIPVIERYNQARDEAYKVQAVRVGTSLVLRYRLKPDGTFLLYSVGEDARDDGGDPTPPSAGKFDLWEGRDAVWPSSAAGPVEPPSKAPRAGQ